MEISQQSLLDLDSALNILKEQKNKLVLDKKTIELRVSELNTKVRSSGKMANFEYKAICDEQMKCRKDVMAIERSLSDISIEVMKKNTLRDKIYHELKKIRIVDVEGDLVELRDYYINFASDKSRVASMRSMGAEFAEKLEIIIKSIQ